jgi:hypothetical protein
MVDVTTITSAIQFKKIIFKTCIAANAEFPTKFLYAMEIRIQRWLGECVKFDDHLMYNDCLASFDKVFEMVINSSLSVILPPNFIRPPPKNPTTIPTVLPGEVRRQTGRKKRKSEEVKRERIVKNSASINNFLIKESKVWKCNFAGKGTRDCPKCNKNTSICVRWYDHGECFVGCNNKASHMGACAVLSTKHSKFKDYLKKVCRENSPSPLA